MSLINDAHIPITDPSDWGDAVVPEFSELDSMLRCQICKGFLKAPVITSCGHVFCSLCIRQTLDVNNRCPLCQEEIFESSLRKILIVDGIVNWFTRHRTDLLDKLKKEDVIHDSQGEEENTDMNIIDLTDSADSGNELKQQRLSIISGEGRSSSPATVPHSETLVECPVCAQFMTIEELQGSHIDRCLRGETKTIKPSMASKRQPTTGNISTFFSPHKRRKQEEKVREDEDSSYQLQPTSMAKKQRIPNLDTMITTNKLKEKLISYNLPTGGTRQQLEARIREYINLYNANLDSLNPVDQRVLIGRLNKWDSLMNQRSNQNHSHSEGEDEEKSDETLKKSTKELKDWRIKYNSTYADLIKKARNSMKTSKEKTSDDPANNGTNK